MLNSVLEIAYKTIQICFTSIDSQDQLFMGLIEIMISLLKDEQQALDINQKRKVESIHNEIRSKVI